MNNIEIIKYINNAKKGDVIFAFHKWWKNINNDVWQQYDFNTNKLLHGKRCSKELINNIIK